MLSVERISERFLIPVLETILETFPFAIQGFHADNGSEYINRRVAELLNKLNIEFTKSRPRHSNDNALPESKNASVVRKHLGWYMDRAGTSAPLRREILTAPTPAGVLRRLPLAFEAYAEAA